MRAFVTGIGGFAGRHLAAHLAAMGDDVRGLIKPGTAAPEGVAAVAVDALDSESVAEAIVSLRPDAVYHLAGLSEVGAQWGRRREYLETNYLGAFGVLEGARRLDPPPRVLLVGSASQYGRVASPGAIRETEPLRPVDPYGVAKAAQELLGEQYARSEGVEVVFVRAFNHTGPGQAPGFVIADWARGIAGIEAGRQPAALVVGNLDVERDFSDVRDVVRAYRLLALEGRSGEAYNVCSGVGLELSEVLRQFRELARTPFAIERSPQARPVDVRSFVGSREKIGREIGWAPSVAFADTLGAVLADARRQIGAS